MSSGSCDPYAVINGQVRMVDHIETGMCELDSGDRLFIFTDGFEYNFKHQEFLDNFVEWGGGLEEETAKLSFKMAENDPRKFGHERSLIGIKA